jgi:PilZ domain-containing protein
MNIRAKIYGDWVEEPLLKAKRPKGAKADELNSIPVPRESRQRSDSRAEDRHRLLNERARVTHDGAHHEVELINLSGGGAMISGALKPLLWDRLDLHLGNHGDIECAVRWIREGRIGLEFAHETRLDWSADEVAAVLRDVIIRSFPDVEFSGSEPDQEDSSESEDEHRCAARHPLIWTGVLHHDYQSTPVRVRNISSTGAMIETATPVRIGTQPLLELTDAASLSVTVEWVVGDQVGVSFHSPFDMNLLVESRPTVAATSWTPPQYLGKAGADAESDEHWGRLTLYELRQELEGFLKR